MYSLNLHFKSGINSDSEPGNLELPEADITRILADWRISSLLVLVDDPAVPLTLEVAKERLNLSKIETERALGFLVAKNIFIKDSNNVYSPAFKECNFSSDKDNFILDLYKTGAQEFLEKVQVSDPFFFGFHRISSSVLYEHAEEYRKSIEKFVELSVGRDDCQNYYHQSGFLPAAKMDKASNNVTSVSKSRDVEQLLHDLKSPLSALKIGIYSLARAVDSDVHSDVFELLKNAINRFEQMIEENKVQKCINVRNCLFKIIDEKKLLGFKSFEIEDLSCSDHLELSGNEVDFHRILSNIFDNSIQAGATAINISSNSTLRKFHLFVSDNGRGISKEDLSKVGIAGFTAGKTEGSGLGLSNAISKLRFWGGDLGIVSEQGVGTTVTITLDVLNI